MCNKRISKKPFENIKWDLQRYWKSLFLSAKNKWIRDLNTQGEEGRCSAKIILRNNIEINKEFNINDKENSSYHAEMNALNEWIEKYSYKNSDYYISKILVSSPPCPKCAVVLECLNLSELVHTNSRNSKDPKYANWPFKKAKELVTLITGDNIIEGVGKDYFIEHADDVYKAFMNESWHL